MCRMRAIPLPRRPEIDNHDIRNPVLPLAILPEVGQSYSRLTASRHLAASNRGAGERAVILEGVGARPDTPVPTALPGQNHVTGVISYPPSHQNIPPKPGTPRLFPLYGQETLLCNESRKWL